MIGDDAPDLTIKDLGRINDLRAAVGRRVVFTEVAERFPDFLVEKGETGVVVLVADDQDWECCNTGDSYAEWNTVLVSVRMDKTHPGAAEWDNEIRWTTGQTEGLWPLIEIID